MKLKFKLLTGLILFSFPMAAQTLKLVDAGSSVKFTIKNFGLTVEGTLTDVEGDITFDIQNPTTGKFNVLVDANSINTGIEMRDNHLRKKDYLDVKTYSHIHFISTEIYLSAKDEWQMTGDLTIKNVTKEISFPFTFSKVNEALLFKSVFKINRRDFDVGGGSFSMADDLKIQLSIQAK